MSDHEYEPFTTRDGSRACRHCHGTPAEHAVQTGPVYGVPLIGSLPLDDGMRQAMPSRADLDEVRWTNERVVAGYEVLLGHYQRLRRVVDYLDSPRVLLEIPQPHRMRLSELLHGREQKPGSCRRCAECEYSDHHWIDNATGNPDDPEWTCKHCDAVGSTCAACDGEGGFVGPPVRPCLECDGEGVIIQNP